MKMSKTSATPSPALNATRMTILVDDRANDGFVAKHGFSVWIETCGQRLLFDTGQGRALPDNSDRLEVDLGSVIALVLSHGHYDHTGVLPLVIARAPALRVYCHPGATGARYVVRAGAAKAIGTPPVSRAALESLPPGRLHWVTGPIEIAPGVGLTGPIPRLTDYEDTGGPFFVDDKGTRRDPIDDDLALWIRTQMGLVVIMGCGHAGLINTLSYARRLSGVSRIHAVLGGFHLLEASGTRVERTMGELAELDPRFVVPCHCTGERAVERLRQALGERVTRGSAGATYTFGDTEVPARKEKT
jgi:7,8-dihydropterin-6-yl-methyl-4-(beta-D-ribofuranosyl)aminobenzene 5'-phosphate synthase